MSYQLRFRVKMGGGGEASRTKQTKKTHKSLISLKKHYFTVTFYFRSHPYQTPLFRTTFIRLPINLFNVDCTAH